MINNNNSLTLDSISVLYGKNMICTYHWLKLKQVTVNINYYSKLGKKKKLVGSILHAVHICDECGTAFITRDEFEQLNEKMNNYYINFRGNIHNVSRYVKSDLDDIVINKFELSTYGYSTDISRKTRWKILVNKIIPTIGINNTVDQIKNFINYNIMAYGKEKALEEWQFDLDRLKDLDIYESGVNQKL